ncbi:MAG: hypothetical protein ABJL67_19670 [Sulfitobacter sp.]
MKTLLNAALLSATLIQPARAQDNLPWIFADCAGRYSAEMEHAWLMRTSEGSGHDAQRKVFASLIEASSTDIPDSALLAHQIQAKQAHAQLIRSATFLKDAKRASFAHNTAETFIRLCQKLLLGG